MSVTGVLLAGGSSSRMGRDKASLEFEGEPLAVRALRVLRELGDLVLVLVASGDGKRLEWLGEPQVADPVPDGGPLAGIVAGLESAPTDLVAVLAVDMPSASSGVFEALIASWQGEDAVVPRTQRGLEPLHAVYSTSAAPPLRAALERGELAVHAAIESLRISEIDDLGDGFAVNVNRPEDLR